MSRQNINSPNNAHHTHHHNMRSPPSNNREIKKPLSSSPEFKFRNNMGYHSNKDHTYKDKDHVVVEGFQLRKA